MEKQRLLELMQSIVQGDQKSQQILIDEYKNFILCAGDLLKNKHESRHGRNCTLTEEELFSEGVVGLLQAAFDSDCWNRFEEAAKEKISRAVESAIIADLAFQSFVVSVNEEFSLYRKIRSRLFRQFRHSPTIQEMEKNLKWPVEKLEQFEKFYQVALKYEEESE